VIVAALILSGFLAMLLLMGVVQFLSTTYLSFRLKRLRRRGALTQALRVARRLLWIERMDRGFGRLTGFLHGGRHELERESLRKGRAGRVLTLCDLLKAMGELDEAQRLAHEAVEHACQIGAESTEGHAILLRNLSGIYLHRGAVAAARPLLEQALAIQRRSPAGSPTRTHPPPQRLGGTLINVGIVYQRLGDYPAAVRAYEEALTVFGQHKRTTGEQVGNLLNNLGTLYLEMGDLDRAGEFLNRAVDHTRSRHGEGHPDYATRILNLAMWHARKRQYPEALGLIHQSVRIRAELLGTRHPGYFHALNNLADTFRQAGDCASARPVVEQAMAGRTAYGEHHPLTTHTLLTCAFIEVASGRPIDALALFRKSSAIDQDLLGQAFSIASDAQRLAYLDKVRKRLFFFLSLVHTHLPGDGAAVADAYDLVLRRKALAAEATAARRDAALGGRYPHLAARLRVLSTLRQQIAARTLAGPGPEGANVHAQLLAGWQEQLASLEVELARAIPEVALEQRLRAADRRAVAAALPAGSALIEFVRFDLFHFHAVLARGEAEWKPARYLAFVLQAGRPDAVQMVDLGEADDLDRLVWAFRTELLGPDAGTSRGMALIEEDRPTGAWDASAADALRQRVFDPLRKAIAWADHLIVAPDGELALVPFEVLPGPDHRPLVEDYLFSYLAVGRDALRSEGRHELAGKPLVIAAPDFDLDRRTDFNPSFLQEGRIEIHPTAEEEDGLQICPTVLSRDLPRSSLRFPPLPATLHEGCEVARLLGVEPAIGPAAVESRLKRADSPWVLHLATHGFFLPDQQEIPEGGFRGAVPENPLLRSGLALAGANTWLAGRTPPGGSGGRPADGRGRDRARPARHRAGGAVCLRDRVGPGEDR
jgi:tetratricopeptide (TPR) repeat protein